MQSRLKRDKSRRISGISVFSSPQFGEVIAMPRGSVLRIANALPTLNGSAVVCIAENALGHAEATARLFVYQNEEREFHAAVEEVDSTIVRCPA
ncbi:hypothetical protein TSMEX_002375 [Taenia solium]|eukprot:TsM_000259800 transcript=TsM_000259800 gene=TsM_000259800